MFVKRPTASTAGAEDPATTWAVPGPRSSLPPSCAEDKRESEIVDFEDDDPENPLNWPYWRKITIQLLVASMYMLGNFGTIIIAPAVPQILREFHAPGEPYLTLLVSIWELGEVFGPFIVAPLSEKFGRLPIYHTGNVLFIIFAIASALSSNISMLVAFRFLNGLTTTSMTLGPSIVGDCFPREERGRSMAVALAIPQIGPFAGPVVGGYLTEAYGWRSCMWFVVGLAGLMSFISVFFVQETYPPVILERKTNRLRKETGNETLRSKYSSHRDDSSAWRSSLRPFVLLVSSPIVAVVSIYTATVYGMSYVVLTTLATTMQTRFGFTDGQTGLAYLGRGLGNLIGMLAYGLVSDRYLKAMRGRRQGESKPEDRLPFMILGSLTIVVGALLYGWGAHFNVAWVVPVLGTTTIGFSLLFTQLPAQNYLVDVFDLFAASAVAISNTLSALCGAFFPLCAPPLYNRVGLGWGNSVLAMIFLLWMPVLFALHRYGERIRHHPKYGIDEQTLAVKGMRKASQACRS